MTVKPLPKWIDRYLPPAGPCLICGGPDKRHRVIDAIIGCVRAGDSMAATARNYELPLRFVRRVMKELG